MIEITNINNVVCLIVSKMSVYHSRDVLQSRAVPAMVSQEAGKGEYCHCHGFHTFYLLFCSDHRAIGRCFHIMSGSVVLLPLVRDSTNLVKSFRQLLGLMITVPGCEKLFIRCHTLPCSQTFAAMQHFL